MRISSDSVFENPGWATAPKTPTILGHQRVGISLLQVIIDNKSKAARPFQAPLRQILV